MVINNISYTTSDSSANVELSVAYSTTAPATDGSVNIWIKDEPPTGGEYISALIEYGDVSVENTQQINTFSNNCLGGGIYNNAIYYARHSGGVGTVRIYKLDLSTFEVEAFDILDSVLVDNGRGYVRGNKFYFIHDTSDDLGVSILNLDNKEINSVGENSLASYYYYSCFSINPSATKIHELRQRVEGGGDDLNTEVYEYDITTLSKVFLFEDSDTPLRTSFVDMLDDDDILYGITSDEYSGMPRLYAFDLQNQKTAPSSIQYCRCVFKIGDIVYLIAGNQNCSIYKINYDGNSIASDLIIENAFSEEYFYTPSTYNNQPFANKYSGYAVDGNTLWLYSTPTSSSAPIIKITLNAEEYNDDSIIISTTTKQKNLATIIKTDKLEIKQFINKVYRKNSDGSTTEVEAYTLSTDGTWLRV